MPARREYSRSPSAYIAGTLSTPGITESNRTPASLVNDPHPLPQREIVQRHVGFGRLQHRPEARVRGPRKQHAEHFVLPQAFMSEEKHAHTSASSESASTAVRVSTCSAAPGWLECMCSEI